MKTKKKFDRRPAPGKPTSVKRRRKKAAAPKKTILARLIVLRGESRGRAYLLAEGENLVGRWDPDHGAFPEVDLEEEDIEAKVSRKHALIECVSGRYSITDLGSLNGTFINRGPRLDAGERRELKAGDEIIVGKTFLRLELGG